MITAFQLRAGPIPGSNYEVPYSVNPIPWTCHQ